MPTTTPTAHQDTTNLAEFGRLRNPLITDDHDDTIVCVKSVLSFVQCLTLQEPADGPVLPDDAATGLFHIVNVCNGALESLRKPSEGFLAAMARMSAADTPFAAPAAPGAFPENRASNFLDLLFGGDRGMTAEACQLSLANAGAVRGRCEDAAAMLDTHLSRVRELLNTLHSARPVRPSAESLDELEWTLKHIEGLVDALRALEIIATEIQQGRRAAGGAR